MCVRTLCTSLRCDSPVLCPPQFLPLLTPPPSLHSPHPPASCRFSAPLVLGHLWAHVILTLRTDFCVKAPSSCQCGGGWGGFRTSEAESPPSPEELRQLSPQLSDASADPFSRSAFPFKGYHLVATARQVSAPVLRVCTEALEGFVPTQPKKKVPSDASDSSDSGFRPAPTSRIPDPGVGNEQEEASVCRDTLFCGCLGGRVYFMGDGPSCVCLFAIDETKIVPPRGHYLPLSCRRRDFPAPAPRHQACPRKRPPQKSLNNSQIRGHPTFIGDGCVGRAVMAAARSLPGRPITPRVSS